ncbi:hypothetical protein [Roseivirga sp.]|uniref:hypothetical protein n=1 Tax=Roseivirga sp. TaxID=1964215 RepID=UPI003B8B0AA8
MNKYLIHNTTQEEVDIFFKQKFNPDEHIFAVAQTESGPMLITNDEYVLSIFQEAFLVHELDQPVYVKMFIDGQIKSSSGHPIAIADLKQINL